MRLDYRALYTFPVAEILKNPCYFPIDTDFRNLEKGEDFCLWLILS